MLFNAKCPYSELICGQTHKSFLPLTPSKGVDTEANMSTSTGNAMS